MKAILKYILISFALLQPVKSFSQDYWLPSSSPTTAFLRTVHFLDSLHGWIGGDTANIFYTSNGGANWTKQDANTRDLPIIDIFFLNENYGWAIAWETQGDNNVFGSVILNTTNGGANWLASAFPYPDVYLSTITFFDTLNGMAGGFPYNMTYTTNGGATWFSPEIDSVGFYAFAPVHDFAFYNRNYGFSSGGHIDIVGVIWNTTNGGLHWSAQGVGPEPVQALHIFDSLNIIAVGGDFEYGSGIVKTTNGGANWDYTSLEIFGIANSLSFRTPQEGWAPLGFALKFVYTLDGGNTWLNTVTPDSAAIYDIQFTDKRNGFAVGDQGVILKYNSSLINIEPGSTNVPRSHRLFQNYPNPFNPSTVISYELLKNSNVTLKLYDIAGKEVLTLKEGFERQGKHEVKLNAEHLAAGIYIYTFKVLSGSNTPDFIQSRKMILVK